MIRYACSNPGCPRRPAVTAETAPTCYTCDRPMAEVARTYEPTTSTSTDWFMPLDVGVPYFGITDPSRATGDDLRRLTELTGCDVSTPPWTPATDATPRVHEDNLTAALVKAIERDAYVPWGGPVIIGFDVQEPTPEQRATRTLPPMTIEVTPPTIDDVETFVRELQDKLQTEMMRVLTTTDRIPYLPDSEQHPEPTESPDGEVVVDHITPEEFNR